MDFTISKCLTITPEWVITASKEEKLKWNQFHSSFSSSSSHPIKENTSSWFFLPFVLWMAVLSNAFYLFWSHLCLSLCCCQHSFLPQGPFKFHLIIKDKQPNKVPITLPCVIGYAPCNNLLIMPDKWSTDPLHGSSFRSVWGINQRLIEALSFAISVAHVMQPTTELLLQPEEEKLMSVCVFSFFPKSCKKRQRAARGQQMTERENSLSPTWLWTLKVGQREKLISRLLNI